MQHLLGKTGASEDSVLVLLWPRVGAAGGGGQSRQQGLQELQNTSALWKRACWGEGGGPAHPAALALVQVKADKLLDAPAVLELSGAAAGQRTRLARRRLSLTHLLGHARQTEPGGGGAL